MTATNITGKDDKGNTYRLELTKDSIKATYQEPGKSEVTTTIKIEKAPDKMS